MPLDKPVSALVEEGKVTISTRNVPRVRRKMFRRLNFGAVPGLAPICLDTNDHETIACGFKKRLLRDLPLPDQDFLRCFATFVKDFVRRTFKRVVPLSFEEWLLSTPYNEARKDELRLAYYALRGARPTARQRKHVDSFGKTEFYEVYKHLRLINSRCDAFKVWSGPMFKAIEEEVYKLHNFVKHTTIPQRVELVKGLRKAGCKYYATDFTAFESHFTPQLMDICECELYRWCLGDTEDARVLCNTLTGDNAMRTRSGVKATVKGRRMSGDMCTSLGNGFTNLMLAKFIAYRKTGDVDSLDGLVEGDDGLFSSTVPISAQDYEKLGFTIKIDEVTDPCCASFCGMIFADSGEVIRSPVRFLTGFGWTHSTIGGGNQVMQSLLRAKALSAVCETPQCPIVGQMARSALAYTRGVLPRFESDGYHHTYSDVDERKLPTFSPSADTRELFSRMYGINPESQLAIEEKIACGQLDDISPILVTALASSQEKKRSCPYMESVLCSAHYAARYIEVT